MTATLDGRPITWASNATWAEVPGVAPFIARLEMNDEDARLAHRGAQVHGSVVTVGGIRFAGLTILRVEPHALSPGLAYAVVADRRWVLHRAPVKRGYNISKTGMDRRRLSGIPIGVAPIAPDQRYHAWSLYGPGAPWEPPQVLQNIMDLCFGRDGWDRRLPPGTVSGLVALVPVVDLDVECNADRALAQVLAYFGRGIQVAINRSGLARLYLADADETSNRKSPPGTKPQLYGSAAAKVSRRMERPKWVDIYYPRVMDLRVNYDATGSETGARTLTHGPQRAYCDWYVLLPEDATIEGNDCVVGTWVHGRSYLTWLAGRQYSGLPDMTVRVLRDLWMFGAAITAYAQIRHDNSGLWLARATELHNSFRNTFGLDPAWVDVLRGPLIPARRVAVLDPETGAQGPGTVYQDYAQWITWRYVDAHLGGHLNEPVGRNVFASRGPRGTGPGGILAPAAGAPNILDSALEDLAPAPARIEFLDPDAFVFELVWRTSWDRQVSRLVPSALIPSSIPTYVPGGGEFDLSRGRLTESHQASFVFAVIPGAPNNLEAMWRDRVKPADLGIQGGSGPPIALFERDPYRIARHGWDDAREPVVRNAFFGRGSLQQALGDPLNRAQLRANSLARARAVYYRFVDAYTGTDVTDLDPDVEPAGRVSSVAHAEGPAGTVTTVVRPLEPPPRDPDSFMSPAALHALRRVPREGP